MLTIEPSVAITMSSGLTSDLPFLSVLDHRDPVDSEFAFGVVPDVDVGHACLPHVLHATVGQPLDERAHDRVVLVIPGVVEQSSDLPYPGIDA